MIEQIKSLSLERQIGQLFFIGFSGTEFDENLNSFISEISPGGICLFARNIKTAEQTRQLLSDVKDSLDIEPLISLDEEGGAVDRLRRITTPLPAANRVKTTAQAERLAEITAEIVRILGFNTNFAPVVDVIEDSRGKLSNGLYSRVFGNSKKSVAELAGAYLEKLQQNGCFGCLKHFPGLGASEVDSHEELPQVSVSKEDFYAIDLYPYIQLFEQQKVHSVMIGHACYPKLDLQEVDRDGKLLPSSLSYNFVTKLLRNHLNYNALAISDDLEMGAIIKNYGIGDACVKAFNAGIDMLAICADSSAIRTGYKAVSDALSNGVISEKRFNESLERIARIKTLLNPPLDFDIERLRVLSGQIADLNQELNYSYGG